MRAVSVTAGVPDERTDAALPAQPAGDLPVREEPTVFAPEPFAASVEAPTEPVFEEPRAVRVGDVLNHLFEVRRSIGRGGMGEVFEGVNVNNDDERVAIKVILPHLSKDPKVVALFRKEARTLTRLGHPVLVHYRTLAQEPDLHALYIVTEFIDGRNLSELLGKIQPSAGEVLALLRRLAEGMAHAHQLGAVHRDLSPDNVMLEGGQLDRPRIIDFGIAKDIGAVDPTILGDMFAGKLRYVAPEQLGAFDRQVGPWSDVYSLGLTILAVLRGADVDMGANLHDAVEKRRSVPDLTAAPTPLRPLLGAMLQPDPGQRIRSMEDVLAGLAALERVFFGKTEVQPERPQRRVARTGGFGRSLAISVGAVLAMAGAGLGAQLLLGGKGGTSPVSVPSAAAAMSGDQALGTARVALRDGIGSIGCSWLDFDDIRASGSGISLRVRGVAANVEQVQAAIGRILSAQGLRAAALDVSRVSPIRASFCAPLDAFRLIRAPADRHIRTAQQDFELMKLPEGRTNAGQFGAPVPIELDLNGIGGDVTLVGLEENGSSSLVGIDRQVLDDPAKQIRTSRPGIYVPEIQTFQPGWSGIVLLYGKGPFDPDLLNSDPSSRGPDWAARFAARARAQGWLAEMVWYRTVDAVPN